jgi:glutathione S-transferase
MKLWSNPLSPFSAKVRVALAEKGIAYESIHVPWSREKGWDKPESLLALNPRGQVPVLVDDERSPGLAIIDSTVIVEYLDEAYPEPALMPRETTARARCRLIEDDADQVIADELTVLIRERFAPPADAEPDPDAAAAAEAAVHRFMDRLAAWLDDAEYLVGPGSPADVASFQAIGFGRALGVAPAAGPVADWFERMSHHPSVAAEYAASLEAAARV